MSWSSWLVRLGGQHRHKFLDALSVLDLAGINIPLRVHLDRVDPVELAGIAAVASERPERAAILPVEYPDAVVRPVGDKDVFLFGVARKRQVIDRAARRAGHVPDAAAAL